MRAQHLIVTGGTGYIGARLVQTALTEGRSVTLLGRSPAPFGTRSVSWRLGESFPESALDRSIALAEQAIVHLAHDWQATDDANVDGTVTLFDAAQGAGVASRVFISSQSARQNALNRYGRMKWTIEERITGCASLRVGLVYGGRRTAMYGLLCRLSQLPVLPMVDPQRMVQPIHIDEVVRGILAAADGAVTGMLRLAGPRPIGFGELLRVLARSYGGRRLAIVPVPLRLALFACDMTARLPLIPTVDRERVLGLAGTAPMECSSDLHLLGVDVRPLAERLAREPAGRRATLAEGRAFLRLAMDAEPGAALIRRYARAVTTGAICRPQLLLRWREPIWGDVEFAKRLRVASRIAEASVSLEATLARGTRLGRLVRLVGAMALEAVMLPSRLMASLMAR
jgi:NADH dehydrogenase